MYDHPRYSQRTVEWGHWGITFLEVQPDRTKNYGTIVASLGFAVGSRGPIDGCLGSPLRQSLKDACAQWVADGTLPQDARYVL